MKTNLKNSNAHKFNVTKINYTQYVYFKLKSSHNFKTVAKLSIHESIDMYSITRHFRTEGLNWKWAFVTFYVWSKIRVEMAKLSIETRGIWYIAMEQTNWYISSDFYVGIYRQTVWLHAAANWLWCHGWGHNHCSTQQQP